MIINRKIFSQRLTLLLKEHNETIYTMAERFDLSPATFSRYTQNKMTPKTTTIKEIADYFGVHYLWLAGYEVRKDCNKKFLIDDNMLIVDLTEKFFKENPDIAALVFTNVGRISIDLSCLIGVDVKQTPLSIILSDDKVMLEDKLQILRSLVDIIKFDTKSKELKIYYNFFPQLIDADDIVLFENYQKLNTPGKIEAKKRIEELTLIDKYTQKKEYE